MAGPRSSRAAPDQVRQGLHRPGKDQHVCAKHLLSETPSQGRAQRSRVFPSRRANDPNRRSCLRCHQAEKKQTVSGLFPAWEANPHGPYLLRLASGWLWPMGAQQGIRGRAGRAFRRASGKVTVPRKWLLSATLSLWALPSACPSRPEGGLSLTAAPIRDHPPALMDAPTLPLAGSSRAPRFL